MAVLKYKDSNGNWKEVGGGISVTSDKPYVMKFDYDMTNFQSKTLSNPLLTTEEDEKHLSEDPYSCIFVLKDTNTNYYGEYDDTNNSSYIFFPRKGNDGGDSIVYFVCEDCIEGIFEHADENSGDCGYYKLPTVYVLEYVKDGGAGFSTTPTDKADIATLLKEKDIFEEKIQYVDLGNLPNEDSTSMGNGEYFFSGTLNLTDDQAAILKANKNNYIKVFGQILRPYQWEWDTYGFAMYTCSNIDTTSINTIQPYMDTMYINYNKTTGKYNYTYAVSLRIQRKYITGFTDQIRNTTTKSKTLTKSATFASVGVGIVGNAYLTFSNAELSSTNICEFIKSGTTANISGGNLSSMTVTENEITVTATGTVGTSTTITLDAKYYEYSNKKYGSVETAITHLRDLIYPVGSIYMSTKSTNPGAIFGGLWKQLKDKFLVGAGDTYLDDTTGGGESGTGNTMPQYLVVYMWERLQ